MKYNYIETVKEDVKNSLLYNYTKEELKKEIEKNREDFENRLHDEMWIDDSITGNASGSYTFNTYKAEENLSHNWDIMKEVADAFGYDAKISDVYEYGAEWWDVCIRCYYLQQAISEVLDEVEAGL